MIAQFEYNVIKYEDDCINSFPYTEVLISLYDFFAIPKKDRIIKVRVEKESHIGSRVYASIIPEYEYQEKKEKLIVKSAIITFNIKEIINDNFNNYEDINHLLLHEFCHFLMSYFIGFEDGNMHNQKFYNYGNMIDDNFQKDDYEKLYFKKYDEKIINRVKKRYELLYDNSEFISLNRKLENLDILNKKEKQQIIKRIKEIKKDVMLKCKSD